MCLFYLAEGKMFDVNNPKDLDRFYHSREWKRVSREVLAEQHYECQICKERHKLTLLNHTRANIHHINEVKDRPDLRLSKFYIDANGVKRRNLIAVCDVCHNELHNRFQLRSAKKQFNEEKW